MKEDLDQAIASLSDANKALRNALAKAAADPNVEKAQRLTQLIRGTQDLTSQSNQFIKQFVTDAAK